MSGIFLVIIVTIWIIFIKWLTPKLVSKIKSARLKKAAGVIVFIFLFILPVIDEIIGGFQFRALCDRDSVATVNEEKVRNRIVYTQPAPTTYLSGYFLPIRKQHWSYVDPDTGEVVISWNEYIATGGLLIKKFSEADRPFTFNGYCYPHESHGTLFKKLNITSKDRR